MRYIVDNPHKHYIAVVDTMAPDGANVVCYNKSAGKQLTIAGARKLAKKLNESWNNKQMQIANYIAGPMTNQLNLF